MLFGISFYLLKNKIIHWSQLLQQMFQQKQLHLFQKQKYYSVPKPNLKLKPKQYQKQNQESFLFKQYNNPPIKEFD